MNGCVLRVQGDHFDPELFLQSSQILPSSVFHRGTAAKGRRKKSMTSGFSCDLGNGTLEQLIDAAERFVNSNRDDLQRLNIHEAVEAIFLDFMIDSRIKENEVLIQREWFPADFVKLLGEIPIGIAICFS